MNNNLLKKFANKFDKKINANIQTSINKEVEDLTYLLEASRDKILKEDIYEILNIGLNIAKETYIAKLNNNLEIMPKIKNRFIQKTIKEKKFNERFVNLLKKDGNIDFYFGFCQVVGREYADKTPENIGKLKNNLFKIV